MLGVDNELMQSLGRFLLLWVNNVIEGLIVELLGIPAFEVMVNAQSARVGGKL